MNLQGLAKAKVLGTPIDAVYQKAEDKSTMLVYGHAENPTQLELGKFLADMGEMVSFGGITEETIKNALPKSISEGIRLSLNHVYFVKESGPEGPSRDDAPGKEYAFWVFLHLEDLTSGFPIEVESVSLKLWSTKSEKILDEMKITEVNLLLQNAGITPQAVEA